MVVAVDLEIAPLDLGFHSMPQARQPPAAGLDMSSLQGIATGQVSAEFVSFIWAVLYLVIFFKEIRLH